ncbi:MAG TPA: dienelactone hydrolase family protein [Actinomycetota bacterium]|nr:dienelactone hydrolase family protein [Actinomycetota bacterium]
MGEVIRFGGGRGAATGYFSATLPRSGPGVLLLHGAPGVTHEVLAVADRLTDEERFSVLAPDLYAGVVPRDPAEAGRLEAGLDSRRVSAILRDASEHLTLNWHPRLGVVDLSAGAARARELAQTGTGEAIVVFDVPNSEQLTSGAPVLVLADETPASAWPQMTDFLRHYLS